MRLGVVFPQTETNLDAADIVRFVKGVECDLGYEQVYIADHVLGSNPAHQQQASARYTHVSPVHEPLTMLAFLAAHTSRVQLATGVLILPQRQAVLVAKQAAQVDILSGGRLRLGVGIGWSQMEYRALGQDMRARGRRLDEQIDVLRRLWTEDDVTYEGEWHDIDHATLTPKPIQRPIPIWLGVGSRHSEQGPPDRALRRVAMLADGWCPNIPTGVIGRSVIARVHELADEYGRSPADIPLQGRVQVAGRTEQQWMSQLEEWTELGATEMLVEVREGGAKFPEGHLELLERFRDRGSR